MRQAINPQMQLGEIDISAITFDAKSRDDIPRLLRALQHIWTNLELRNQVFQVLDTMTSTDKKNGRPGMELWKILVFGTLRLVTNCDYDRLKELANEHGTLRKMLGHGPYTRLSSFLMNECAIFRQLILERRCWHLSTQVPTNHVLTGLPDRSMILQCFCQTFKLSL